MTRLEEFCAKIMEEKKTFTSAAAFLAYSKPEEETLDSQLERLSLYIEDMVEPGPRQTITADESQLFSTLRNTSIDWEVGSCFMDSEDCLLHLERSTMTREDFRSFEMRRAKRDNVETVSIALQEALGTLLPQSSLEELVDAVRALMNKEIICSLHELYEMQSQLQQIISLAEEGICFEGQMNVGSYLYLIRVKSKNSTYFKQKEWLFELLKGKTPDKSQKTRGKENKYGKKYTQALETTNKLLMNQLLIPKSIEEYSRSLQSDMNTAYEDFYPSNVFPVASQRVPFVPRSAASLQMEMRQLQRTKEDHEAVKQNFAWDSAELSILKSDYIGKSHKLRVQKDFLMKHNSLLKQRVIQFEKEKAMFEEREEEFEAKKKFYEEIQDENRERMAHINLELLEKLDGKIEEKPRSLSRPGTPTSDDPRVQELRQEIADLEYELSISHGSKKETLALKLTRSKTKLSNLRSQMAIASSLYASASVKNVLKKVDSFNSTGSRSFCVTPNRERSFQGRQKARAPTVGYIDADYPKNTSPALPPPRPPSSYTYKRSAEARTENDSTISDHRDREVIADFESLTNSPSMESFQYPERRRSMQDELKKYIQDRGKQPNRNNNIFRDFV